LRKIRFKKVRFADEDSRLKILGSAGDFRLREPSALGRPRDLRTILRAQD
jgi:hypothetical protein